MIIEPVICQLLEPLVHLQACPSAIIVDAMSVGPVLYKHAEEDLPACW
jgi:hypothetical protein